MYSVIIVDDEKFQQETLLRMMETYASSYQILHVCSSVEEGIIKIKELNPQLVFLDVMMPPLTGFDLLNSIGKINFEIIFTTSFEKFALKAFKVSAVDYLLKPFGKEDLLAALEKFENKISGTEPLNHIELLLQNINSNQPKEARIALPTLSGYVFVMVNDILRIEADNTYTTFFFSDQKPLVVAKSIKEYDELLKEYDFFRPHISHLVNMRHVKEYLKGDGGTIIMTDNSRIEVARNRKEGFLNLLNKL